MHSTTPAGYGNSLVLGSKCDVISLELPAFTSTVHSDEVYCVRCRLQVLFSVFSVGYRTRCTASDDGGMCECERYHLWAVQGSVAMQPGMRASLAGESAGGTMADFRFLVAYAASVRNMV